MEDIRDEWEREGDLPVAVLQCASCDVPLVPDVTRNAYVHDGDWIKLHDLYDGIVTKYDHEPVPKFMDAEGTPGPNARYPKDDPKTTTQPPRKSVMDWGF